MEKFVPYEKLSKKKKRALDAMRRGTWGAIKPVTRKPESSKAYNRKKAQDWRKNLPDPVPNFYENAGRADGREEAGCPPVQELPTAYKPEYCTVCRLRGRHAESSRPTSYLQFKRYRLLSFLRH